MTRDNDAVRHGVVVVVARDGRFLMIRRAPLILAGGAWCFVGGGIEPGEDQAAAVEREFAEEVGGQVRALRRIWEYVRPDGRLHLHWWLAELLDGRLVPNAAEVSEVRWCTLPEIEALPNVLESNRRFIQELGPRVLEPHEG